MDSYWFLTAVDRNGCRNSLHDFEIRSVVVVVKWKIDRHKKKLNNLHE